MKETIDLLGKILTNILTALYEPFGFSLLISFLALFFYLYAYEPTHAGKGWKSAIVTWYQKFKESAFFRKLFLLVFVTSMILFRTLLNRNLWMNPLSNVMGGWSIWETVNGEQKLTTLTPVWDSASGQWRAGMWVRDSSAGVGTLTFADEEKGVFAGLGHPISDSDTGESIALRSGEIVPCQITGCSKGTAGSPGELKGRFLSAHAIGTIRINGENGVYGSTRAQFAGQKMEVAFAQEVEAGDAEIWTTTSGETPRAYRVKIEKISDADPRRNMVLRVVDRELLAQTGGIVQGMSGSPIVQNGRLVGAVTHVLVNDPTRGYGIFAQTMLEQAEQVTE